MRFIMSDVTHRQKSSEGFSLVATMIGLAILAIVVVGTISAITAIMRISTKAHANEAAIEAVKGTLAILSSPALCDGALTQIGGAGVASMDLSTLASVPIGQINMNNAYTGAAPSVYLTTSPGGTGYTYNLNNTVVMNGITVQEASVGQGRSQLTLLSAGKTYNVFSATVQLTFKMLNGDNGPEVPAIPLSIAVNTTNPADYLCYTNLLNRQTCEGSGGHIDTPPPYTNTTGQCVSTQYDNITKNGSTGFECCMCDAHPNALTCNTSGNNWDGSWGACGAQCVAPPLHPSGPCTGTSTPVWTMSGFTSVGGIAYPTCTCNWICSS